ncbi:MAG: adenosine deaminase [Acidimicrobiales bacterium]
MNRPTDAQVRALPKVELHVHVEGAVKPATIAELARRNGVDLGVDDPAELYRYRDLTDFLRVFDLVCRSLRTADDLHRVTFEALAIAAAAGVRRREMFFSPTFLMRHGVPFDRIWQGIAAGVRDAEVEHGIVCRMILDVHKPAGPGAAVELIDLAATCDRDLLIGIGGDAGEIGIDLAAFGPAFDHARRLGFRTTMHLGEEGPASDVATGVRVLGLDRIDHGATMIDDPELVAEVAERRIPLTVCPTSNVAIGVVPSMAAHPIDRFVDAGVLVTVNSDNAEMFGVDVADELCALRDTFGWGDRRMREVCLAGVDAAWVDPVERAALRAEFERDLDAVLGAA